MKTRQRIIIGLHADIVRVHVVRGGKIARTTSVHAERARDCDPWEDGLRAFDDALTNAIEQANVSTPCDARVIYDSPTAAVSAGATPAGGRAGAEASLLELETRGGADLSLQSHAAWVLGTESDGSGYSVAVTDSPLTLDTLSRFLDRAGITMLSATPAEAVGLSGALAMHSGSSLGGARVCAWLGEWCSGVVVANDSGVRFVRSSPLTVDALISALLGVPGMDDDLARAMLRTVGIPGSRGLDNDPEAPQGIDLHDARASIQPLLQRTAVDLRQSLRFGLGKDDMERAVVRAGGHAADVPGLVPLVGELLNVRSETDTSFDGQAHIVEALDRLRLIDDDRSESATAGRVQRALWVGAAAALGVSVAQGMLASDEASREQAALQAMRSGATSMESIYEREQVAERLETQIANVRHAVRTSTGFAPRWPGWLADLAERCPERIVVLAMSGTRSESEGGDVMLSGAIVPETIAEGSLEGPPRSQMDLLNEFIAGLEGSPLVESVELGPTRRGSALGEDATSFELTVTLRPAPTTAPSIAEAHDG